jgi:starvation-inducible outer membrane lipoprotein
MFRFTLIALVAILVTTNFAVGQTVRCGSKIVKIGMTADEVLGYCGPPTRKEVEEHDVRSGGRVVGVTYLHRWFYDRGFSGKPKVLEFDQDKLIAIK